MSAQKLEPSDEWIAVDGGYVPYRYLERVAICMLEGKLSEEEAHRIAARELQREATGGPLAESG